MKFTQRNSFNLQVTVLWTLWCDYNKCICLYLITFSSDAQFLKCVDKAWGMVNCCSGKICFNPQEFAGSEIKQSSICKICTAATIFIFQPADSISKSSRRIHCKMNLTLFNVKSYLSPEGYLSCPVSVTH